MYLEMLKMVSSTVDCYYITIHTNRGFDKDTIIIITCELSIIRGLEQHDNILSTWGTLIMNRVTNTVLEYPSYGK